uniref:Uncharacterized protein n=1 Tax=viral metagenome TaxID=1070528 RepID=A0A6M3KY97_9ZZZZ
MQTSRKVSNINPSDMVAIARTHNVLRNINFNQKHFITRTMANGLHVSLSSAESDAEDLDFHFQLEANATAGSLTSYICRGGYFVQDIANTQTVTGLQCDGDVVWNEDYEDSYKSFTLPANVASYVYTDYAREEATPILEVKSSLTWPAMEDDSDIVVIGKINTYSGVIEQYFRDDIYDDFLRPDTYSTLLTQETIDYNWYSKDLQLHEVSNCYPYSYSMCFYDADEQDVNGNTTGELRWSIVDSHWWGKDQRSIEINTVIDSEGTWYRLQLWNFNDATSSALESDSLITFRDADGPELKYADADDLVNWINAYSSGFCDLVMNCFDGDICQYINDNCDLSANHYDLLDIAAGGYVKHDHGNYWQNRISDDGRYGSHSCDYQVNNGSSIGDSDGLKVIDQDNEQLMSSLILGRVRLDWHNCYCYNQDAVKTMDWHAGQCYDLAGNYSHFWISRYLFNSNGQLTEDYNLCHLHNCGSLAIDVTLDWKEKALRDATVDILTWSTTAVTISRKTDVTDGTRTLSICDGTFSANASHHINSSNGFSVATTQVVGAQQLAEADIGDTSGPDNDGICRAKLNALLAKLRTHGLIAS